MSQLPGSVSIQSIPAGSSATATVPAVLDNGVSKAWHSMAVNVSAGVASGAVTLELSHDGSIWFTSGSPPTLTASTVQTQTINAPAQFVRARISTVVSGGTVGVSIASA